MSFAVFVGYSKRFLTSKLSPGLPYDLRRSVARGIRVLWYMEHMGGGWLTVQDLRTIGAGQWRSLRYIIPDLLNDVLIDEIKLSRKSGRPYSKYKITKAGRQLLDEADKHVRQEYSTAVARITAFKDRYGIKKIDLKGLNR